VSDGPAIVGFRSEKLDADEERRLREIREAGELEVFAAVELERVEGSDALLVFTGSGPDHGTLWVQGGKHDAEFRGRSQVRVTFEGSPVSPRYLVRAAEAGGGYPATLQVWEERQNRKAARREQALRDTEAHREELRATAEPVLIDDTVRDGGRMTLREAGEAIVAASGTLRVEGGRLVVSLPPGALLTMGQPSAALRAASRLYLAETEVVATASKRGEVAVARLPSRFVLPSGALAP
jgi:hypothetical protein